MWYELKLLLQHNDPITYIILVLTLISAIVVFERFLFLGIIYNLNTRKFMSDLLKIITASDYDRAITFCKRTSKHGLPKIMEKSVMAYLSDPQSLRGKLEEEALDFIPLIEKRLSLISSLGNTVLMIGLTGTAIGIWSVFNHGEIMVGSLKQDVINTGLSRSLNITIFSLIISTAIHFSHSLLKASAIKIVDGVESSVLKIANLLAPPPVAVGAVQTVAAAAPEAPHEEPDLEPEEEEEEEEEIEDLDDESFEEEAYDIKDEEEII